MDRIVIFVDAGHLLAEGGNLCCGTKKRAELACKYRELIDALISRIGKDSPLEVLRVYWYDGAREAIPTADHLEVSRLPNTKLRLGRLSGNKQKGVDALIVRDMMKLSSTRAMATAYLLAGDEDLRVGVTEAQEFGVRVLLLGIPPVDPTKTNQADTLIRECDGHHLLDKTFLMSFFSRQSTRPVVPIAMAASPGSTATPAAAGAAAKAGQDFADAWVQRASHAELSALWRCYPRIPVELDVQLLRDAETKLGSLRGQDVVRSSLRKSFWATIEKGFKKL